MVAHTDSRFRPDQRIFETGDCTRGDTLKKEVEEMQRGRRK